ncbi:MAG: aminoacyl-tRNA hydrolase [Candidatus Omnitrophica bacterium]|nr:aminoacyl-tRNA hydrolase [Candidatus Omnitrophota bacterium]
MKLIVGLGNPGKKYKQTRHNAGFLVVDALLEHDRNQWVVGKGPFQINQEPFQNGKAFVAKPTLFMNESGLAVQALIDQFQVSFEECLVIVDDVNLPVGKIRFRPKGSAGGHHGLESIIRILGREDFPRLRIGVGSGDLGGKDLTHYVLGDFSKEEWAAVLPQIEWARDACLEWLQNDLTAVMQQYNN